MCRQLEQMKKERIKNGSATTMSSSSPSPPPSGHLGNRGTTCTTAPCNRDTEKMRGNDINCSYECVALHVSPDLGERVMLSGGRALLDEVFPESTQAVIDARSGVTWHQQDARHVIRFPLNGYCKLNSVQAITRLLNAGFRVVASNGGGVEGQQFSEYLFVRQAVNTWRNSAHQRKTISRSIRCLQREHDPEWVPTVQATVLQDCIANNTVYFGEKKNEKREKREEKSISNIGIRDWQPQLQYKTIGKKKKSWNN